MPGARQGGRRRWRALLLVCCLLAANNAALRADGETLQTIESRTPPAGELLLRQAFAFEAAGELQSAAQAYQQFFDGGGDGAHAHASFARLLLRLDRHAEALTHAAAARRQSSADPDLFSLEAEARRLNSDRDGAFALLFEAAERFPDHPEPVFAIAEGFQNSNQAPQAAPYYTHLLTISGDGGVRAPQYRSIALWRLSETERNRGASPAAALSLREYIRLNPDRLYARALYADLFAYRSGNFADARRMIDELLEEDPAALREQNVDVRYMRSLQVRLEYLSQGGAFFSLLRELEREGPLNLLEQGLAQERRGEDEEAIARLSRVVSEFEREYAAWVGLLRITQRRGRSDLEGRQLLNLALIELRAEMYDAVLARVDQLFALRRRDAEAAPPADQLHRLRAMALSGLNQPLRAAVAWRRSAELAGMRQALPDQLSALLARAQALAAAGPEWRDEALLSCQQAAAIAPESVQVDIVSASIQLSFAGGDPSALDAALAAVQRARARSDDAALRLLEARVQFERREDAAALKLARSAFEDVRVAAEAYNFAGYMLADANQDLPRARQYIEQAMRRSGGDPHVLDSLGWLQYREGRFCLARLNLAAVNSVLERRGAHSLEAIYHLVQAESACGRKERAGHWLERARQLAKELNRAPSRSERAVIEALGVVR